MKELLVIYNCIAFALGMFFIGSICTILRYNKNEIIKYYLLYYSLFTSFIGLFVLGSYFSLVFTFNPFVKNLIYALEFLCLFLSLFFFTYLVNKAYQVNHSKFKNTSLFLFTLVWWALCCYEEIMGLENEGFWLAIDDEFITIILFIYILITYIVYKRNIAGKPWYLDIRKIFIVILSSTPGLIFDGLIAGHGQLLYFTPLFFVITSTLGMHFIFKYNHQVQDTTYELHQDFIAQFSITPRESEVILLLLKGYSYNKISETLCISISTVRSHVMNIYKKVGVNSRYELCNKAY